jgi:hypothetical protein
MSRSSRSIKYIKSGIVGFIALFMALSGTAYAQNTVRSEDIVNGEVKSVDVQNNGLGGIDVTNNSLTGLDVADNSLTGLDVNNNSLTGLDVSNNSLTGLDVSNNSLTGLDVSDNSLTGADISNNSLTGADIAENTLSVRDMGCQSGKVLGFARIKGTAPIPNVYTTSSTAIDITNNCAGGRVEVRRASTGVYFVRFVGNPAALALAVPNQDGASSAFSGDTDNVVTVGKINSGPDAGAFRVDVTDLPGPGASTGGRQNGQFTMTLP